MELIIWRWKHRAGIDGKRPVRVFHQNPFESVTCLTIHEIRVKVLQNQALEFDLDTGKWSDNYFNPIFAANVLVDWEQDLAGHDRTVIKHLDKQIFLPTQSRFSLSHKAKAFWVPRLVFVSQLWMSNLENHVQWIQTYHYHCEQNVTLEWKYREQTCHKIWQGCCGGNLNRTLKKRPFR